MQETDAHAADGALKILLANKSDHPRAIPALIESGRALAMDNNMSFFVVSAKTGSNVSVAFETLARECLQAVRENKLTVRRKRQPFGGLPKKTIKPATRASGFFSSSSSWCSLL